MVGKKIKVALEGIRPIMFDRFERMGLELPPREKMYTDKKGNVVLPAKNIMSFLTAINTESATRRVMGRTYKKVAKAAMSFVTISPNEIPFTCNGKKIDSNDERIYIDYDKAIVMKGSMAIPNPKERPVLPTPWELYFEMTLWENDDLNESLLRKIWEDGGLSIGLGTFRGLYGKFIVKEWTSK